MQQLLNQLNSRNPTICDAALRTARALLPGELLQLVLLESRNRRALNSRGWAVYIGASTLFMAYMTIFHISDGWAGLYTAFAIAFAGMCQTAYANRFNQARIQIGILLSEVEDSRFIAPILRLQSGLSNDETKELRTAVKRLLPQIRADHAQTWSKEDKAALLLPLRSPDNDKELTLGCLKALEQVGDASTIPAVRRLLEKMYPAKWEDEIAVAAQECLLYLQSNTGRFQQAETLLRASEPATVRPDILLRPAQPAPDTTPAEQLLRPGE